MTEAFSDFSAHTGLIQLAITRTYSSADVAYHGGAPGIFGRGWHHEWEGWISCSSTKCTVVRGTRRPLQFSHTSDALSLDGTENWAIYTAWSNVLLSEHDNHSILIRRPNGEWILFSPDGSESHFATACDTCGNPESDPYCQDPALGGKARLVKVVNAAGNAVQLAYDRPAGVLIGLSDDLGHALEVVSTTACLDGLASSLRYDGTTLASYGYIGSDLVQATDADGHLLRGYAYDGTNGRLLAVLNEAGDAIAAFSYDTYARANGVIDKMSSVSVDYSNPATPIVTEYFGSTSSASVRALNGDGTVASISDGCACGPARTMTWANRRLVCTADALGHVTWRDYDSDGRLTHTQEYRSTSGCPATPPNSFITSESREEWRTYGVTRPIAQGLGLPLEVTTSISRVGGLGGRYRKYIDTYSYDPGAQGIDPPGYSCQEAALPAGSVVCRRIETGWTRDFSGSVFSERHASFYSYDSRGRLTKTRGPINLDYPSASDVMPLEERTYWPDDATLARRGRLHQVKRYPSPTATPMVTTYDYDAFGPYAVTQPDGGVTVTVKDGRGRPVLVLAPGGGAWQTRYHDGLDPAVEILATGRAIRSTYDGLGRVIRRDYLSGDPDVPGATPTLGWSEHFTYDAAGNPVHVERRDTGGVVTWQQDRTFDAQHRMLTETNPEDPSKVRMQGYDASGFLSTVTDEQGRVTGFTPDGINRVKKVTRSGLDAAGMPVSLDTAQYSYTTYTDELYQAIDGKGVPTTYTYDDFGRLMMLTIQGMKFPFVYFSYDARGNLLSTKKSYYTTITYTYDGLDRVLTRSAYNSSTGVRITDTFSYDAPPHAGRLTRVVESDRTVSFTYDQAGRLASESVQESGVPAPLVTSYQYDMEGGFSDIVYPSGLHLEFSRDPATHRVVRVKNAASATTYADQVVHAPGHDVVSLAFGNGFTLAQTFNRRGEPVTISSGPLSLGYEMSAGGDVNSMTESGATRTFGYDFLDRLTSSSGWLAYGYDNAGSRTSETLEGVQGNYTYSGSLVSQRVSTAGVSQHGYGYDYESNLSGVGVFNAAGTAVTTGMCLRHDPLGRLVMAGPIPSSFLSPSYFYAGTICYSDYPWVQAATARFRYDHRGRRIGRWLASTNQWTYIISDPEGNPLSEVALVDGAWSPVRDYVWLDGRPLAQVEYPGPGGNSQGYAYYYHLDHIGLPRALTNESQQVVWSATQRPYGDVVESSSVDPLSGRVVVTNLRLPGQYDERLLGSLGLQGPYYNWNRWYLPGVGRYLELDPLALRGQFNSPFGPDWYNYANGNPLSYIDPDGREGTCEIPPDPCTDPYQTPPDWLPDWLPIKKNFNSRCGNKKKTCQPCACVFPDGSTTIMNWTPPKNEFECRAECTMPQRGKPPAVAYRCSGVTVPITVPPN